MPNVTSDLFLLQTHQFKAVTALFFLSIFEINLLCPYRKTYPNSFRAITRFFWLHQVSQQDQYRNIMVRMMQSKSPFQRWRLVCFHSNTVFIPVYNRLLYNLYTHKIWKRSVEIYKSYGTLSKTTHFLTEFCEAGVVQQCTEAQAGVVQDGLTFIIIIIYPLTARVSGAPQMISQPASSPHGESRATYNLTEPTLSMLNMWPLNSSWNFSAHLALSFLLWRYLPSHTMLTPAILPINGRLVEGGSVFFLPIQVQRTCPLPTYGLTLPVEYFFLGLAESFLDSAEDSTCQYQ